jgi:hypothetical protein
MIRALVSLVLVTLLVGATPAGAAQPIGRLFFTPAERAQLDVARANKRVAEPASSKPSEPPPPQTQIITYNGIVRRSDGKSILWLNSRAADEKEALSGLPVSGRVRPDGGVTLQVPNTGGTIDLKVGQRAELQTGRVVEARPAEKDSPKPDAAKAETAKGGEAAKGEAAKNDKDAPKTDAKAPAAPGKSAEAGDKKGEAATAKAPEADARAAKAPAR